MAQFSKEWVQRLSDILNSTETLEDQRAAQLQRINDLKKRMILEKEEVKLDENKINEGLRIIWNKLNENTQTNINNLLHDRNFSEQQNESAYEAAATDLNEALEEFNKANQRLESAISTSNIDYIKQCIKYIDELTGKQAKMSHMGEYFVHSLISYVLYGTINPSSEKNAAVTGDTQLKDYGWVKINEIKIDTDIKNSIQERITKQTKKLVKKREDEKDIYYDIKLDKISPNINTIQIKADIMYPGILEGISVKTSYSSKHLIKLQESSDLRLWMFTSFGSNSEEKEGLFTDEFALDYTRHVITNSKLESYNKVLKTGIFVQALTGLLQSYGGKMSNLVVLVPKKNPEEPPYIKIINIKNILNAIPDDYNKLSKVSGITLKSAMEKKKGFWTRSRKDSTTFTADLLSWYFTTQVNINMNYNSSILLNPKT